MSQPTNNSTLNQSPQHCKSSISQIQISPIKFVINKTPSPPLSENARPLCNKKQPQTLTHEYNNRILAAKRSGYIGLVMQEFTTMKKKCIPMTHHTYNLVLEAHAIIRREGNPLKIMLKLYNEMFQLAIQPNFYTYTLMIRTLCKRDVEVQKTIAMLKRKSARAGQEQKDIASLKSENNLSRALSIFYYALQDGVSIQYFDIDIFNQLLRVLSHYGNEVDAHYVYSQLSNPYVQAQPNAATYAALINLYGRAGNIQMALHFYHIYLGIVHTLGPHDASYIYNALVDCHLKCGLLIEALYVIEHDMTNHGIELTCLPYNSIIRHYCSQDQLAQAEALILRMEASEALDNHICLPHPDASSYGPILSACCRLNRLDDATRIYQAIIRTDITKSYGNLANYLLLCLSHGKRDDALAVVEDMTKAELQPDVVIIQRITHSYVESNELTEAVSVLQKLSHTMNKRTVTKNSEQLLEIAYTIIDKQQQQNNLCLSLVLHVVHLSISFLSSTIKDPFPPLNLSKILIQCYLQNNANDLSSLSIIDYELMLDAAFVVSQEASSNTEITSSFGEIAVNLWQHMKVFNIATTEALYLKVLSQIRLLHDEKSEHLWLSICDMDEDDAEVIIYIDDDLNDITGHSNSNTSLSELRDTSKDASTSIASADIVPSEDHPSKCSFTPSAHKTKEILKPDVSFTIKELCKHFQYLISSFCTASQKEVLYKLAQLYILQHPNSEVLLKQLSSLIGATPYPVLNRCLLKSHTFIVTYDPLHADQISIKMQDSCNIQSQSKYYAKISATCGILQKNFDHKYELIKKQQHPNTAVYQGLIYFVY